MIHCHDEDPDDLLPVFFEDELANACSDQSDYEDISQGRGNSSEHKLLTVKADSINMSLIPMSLSPIFKYCYNACTLVS
jgi:hypothetical protein